MATLSEPKAQRCEERPNRTEQATDGVAVFRRAATGTSPPNERGDANRLPLEHFIASFSSFSLVFLARDVMSALPGSFVLALEKIIT